MTELNSMKLLKRSELQLLLTDDLNNPEPAISLMKIRILLIIAFIMISLPVRVNAAEKAVPEKGFDWFWFLYEKTVDKNYNSVVYRPFYLDNKSPVLEFQASLMPLLFWRYIKDNNDEINGFFGFYNSTNHVKSEGEKVYDTDLFPLYMYGS